MRIISGKARGTKLKTLEGVNTRPTLERVKESVFSIIQFDIIGACVLDLFAGSGQLALEALSRGAEFADLADSSREAVGVIKENIAKTHFEKQTDVRQTDSNRFLSLTRKKYGLVFLDPPYANDMLIPSLKALVSRDLLAEGAVVVCEMSADDSDAEKNVLGFCADIFDVRKNNVYAKSRIIVLDYGKKSGKESESEI